MVNGKPVSVPTRFWTVRGRMMLDEVRGVEFWNNARNVLRYVYVAPTTLVVAYDCPDIDDAAEMAMFMAERTGAAGYVQTGARDDQPAPLPRIDDWADESAATLARLYALCGVAR